jgi:hypothetical protein
MEPRAAPVGSPLDAWSVPGGFPEGDTILEGEVLPGGLLVRRLVPDRSGAEGLMRRLRDGRRALLERPSAELCRVLGGVGERFLAPTDALREEALRLLPATADVSSPMARAILDGMARDWSRERLESLLAAELEGGAALDGFVEQPGLRGRRRALGPALTAHVCSGSVPGVSVTSLVRGLLVRSAVLLKPGRGDEVLPLLFRRGLAEADPELAEALAVVYWPGGAHEALEAVALESADLVVVYGDDEAVRGVRARVRATTPVVVYPHRVGFAVVGRERSPDALAVAARDAARAVALFEQRGCVSPHLVYVLGGPETARTFAGLLAGELARLESELPGVAPEGSRAALLHQERGAAEMLAASGRGEVWSGGAASWTVVLETDTVFRPSCLGRFVRVKPAESPAEVLEAVRPWRRHLQTVGVAGLDASLAPLAEGLARLGAVRVAPLHDVPFPPAWWHHDGEGPLGALVRWTDLEA